MDYAEDEEEEDEEEDDKIADPLAVDPLAGWQRQVVKVEWVSLQVEQPAPGFC